MNEYFLGYIDATKQVEAAKAFEEYVSKVMKKNPTYSREMAEKTVATRIYPAARHKYTTAQREAATARYYRRR